MFSAVKLSLTSKLISNIKFKLNPMSIIKMDSSSMSFDSIKVNNHHSTTIELFKQLTSF